MDLQNITQQEFELIEAYISGQLTGESLTDFEKKLKTDSDFRIKVEDVKIILAGIETQVLKEQLNDFHLDLDTSTDNSENDQTTVVYLNWKRLLVAAALIIAAGSFWFLNGNSNERLYAKYFEPDPGLPTTMSTNSDFDFNKAMVDYKQGNYKEALDVWKKQLNNKAKNDTLNYFIGVTHLANNNANEAVNYLNTVTQLSENTFKEDALYYLSFAHLKTDNKNAAIKALETCNLPECKDLLEKLK